MFNISNLLFSDAAGLGSPYFPAGAGGIVNVTTQLESTTYLNCYVNRLGGKTVSPPQYEHPTLFTVKLLSETLPFHQEMKSNPAAFSLMYGENIHFVCGIIFPLTINTTHAPAGALSGGISLQCLLSFSY